MYMDPGFNCVYKLITGTDINTPAARDHIPEIERQIKVIKGRMRAIHGGLPYNRMASRMVIDPSNYIVMMINAFPPNIGILWTIDGN